jgi:hypothetical protein
VRDSGIVGRTSGAKARPFLENLAARLKSCPSQNRLGAGLFSTCEAMPSQNTFGPALDALLHKNVVGAFHGLFDFLSLERKRVPSDVFRDAERLECLVFMAYDPYFKSDEPPVL